MEDLYQTAGFNILSSNRTEILSYQLAQIMRTPLSSPLMPETIVIQSQGMERWVSMEIAGHNGICGNCQFPFPNTFLRNLTERIFPDLPETDLFQPQILTFRIMGILGDLLHHPAFTSLKSYLQDDPHHVKLFQLSERIADTFDQYLVFRPDMMLAWESGKKDHWQAVLWRELVSIDENRHRARLRKDLINEIAHRSSVIQALPERVFIFGVSHLPPFHMQVFSALSTHIPVYLFLLNPCKEYWGDIVSDKEQFQIRETYKGWSAMDIKAGCLVKTLHNHNVYLIHFARKRLFGNGCVVSII